MDINTPQNNIINNMNPGSDEGKKIGPVIGALIIVILLIVAALYFWGNRLNKSDIAPRDEAPVVSATSRDDVSALDEDLNAMERAATIESF